MATHTIKFILFLSLALVFPLQAVPEQKIDNLLRAFSKDPSLRDTTVQSLVRIMEQTPADPAVPKALAWLIRYGGVSEGSDYDRNEAFFKRIEKHHGNNDQLAGALVSMIGFREPEAIAFLTRLGKNSQSDLVAATALTSLASSYEFDDEAIKRYDNILKEIITRFPNLKYHHFNITAHAKNKLYASQNLRIGKTAPEIQGEDADGKHFKLSDYRGKIIFLNFWGDW